MKTFPEKQCQVCSTMYIPTGSSSKYCSKICATVILKAQQKIAADKYNLKLGRKVGVGKGGATGFGKDNAYYRNGLGIFAKLRKGIKESIRYCEVCNKDLKDVSRYEWCVHHKDHNRHNNDVSNFQLLCKRCHQLEHNCIAALEGVTTKRDELTVRYKRTEAPATLR